LSSCLLVFLPPARLSLSHNALIKGVANTIVPEVEALRHVDGASQPLAEVWVSQLSFFLAILVDHEFLEIVVVQVRLVSEILQEVFDGYKPIEVLVKLQEGLAHRFKAVRKLDLELLLEHHEALLDVAFLLVILVVYLVSEVLCNHILLVIFGLLNEIKLWKEYFLESVVVDAFGVILEHVEVCEEEFDLLSAEGDSVLDYNAVHKGLFRYKTEPCEVMGSKCIFRTAIHFLELHA
jgi:hypothetical protein